MLFFFPLASAARLGVALFGAIFANRLHAQLAGPGMDFPCDRHSVGGEGACRPSCTRKYITAVMLALQPVFPDGGSNFPPVGFAPDLWMLRE